MNSFLIKQNDLSVNLPTVVHDAFKANGYVAGGFVRQTLINDNKIDIEYIKNGGDIDVFFQDEKEMTKFLKSIKSNYETTSVGTHKVLSINDKIENQDVKIQFVGLMSQSPIELMSEFPTINTRAAFNEKLMWVDTGFFECQKKKLVSIGSLNTLWLANHVYKLVNKKGMIGLDEASKTLFIKWINSKRISLLSQTLDITNCLNDKRIFTNDMLERIDIEVLKKKFKEIEDFYSIENIESDL